MMRSVRVTLVLASACCGLVFMSAPAFAGSHTWDVNEIFSNADGTIQFIELVDPLGPSELGLPGQTMSSDGTSFTIVGPPITAPTTNKFYLIATQSFADLPNAPTPDAIIPVGVIPFFSTGGDTISYVPWDDRTFGPGVLPVDGITSLNLRTMTTGANSPTNFAGVTGSVDLSGPPTCTNVSDCSGHGTCVATDVCNCDAGWAGLDCGTAISIPTVSQWGMLAMAIMLVGVGATVLRRRQTSGT